MSGDVLSDVLRGVRLTGAVFFDFELSSPWVAEAPPSQEIAGSVMPGAHRVIEYHLIARGRCWGHAIGADPIALGEGDLIVFPQGDGHVLSSAPGMRAVPDHTMFVRRSAPLPLVYEMGGGGDDRARVVCGFVGCDDRPYNPLLGALPKTIHLSARGPQAVSGWLATLVHIAVTESGARRPGGENVLARLSELIFVEVIRQHLETSPIETGWLAGLRDPIVGKALAAIHAEPAGAWTVEGMGRAAGVSRSVFAERFTAIVGQPPMQYLALWRTQLASRLLAEGGQVAAVAAAVGYESEAAFSRAFKKIAGRTPAAWRRSASAAPAGAARAMIG